MLRKTSIVIVLVMSLVAFYAIDSGAWPNWRTLTFTISSPYTAIWTANGNVDGQATATALLVNAAIEWKNPNGKSVIDGLGGEQLFDPIESIASFYLDDNGQITITAQFPYIPAHCDPDDSEVVQSCVDQPGDNEIDDFLYFYTGSNEYYKDNWFPTRMIMLEVELYAWAETVLNDNNTKEGTSPIGVCIANETYRTFELPITYICNDAGDPFAIDDAYVLKKDTFSGDVLENDFDRDVLNDHDLGEYPLTAQLVDDVANGVLQLNPDGTFTYTKGDDFPVEGDSFTYQAVDALGNVGNVATVLLTSFK